MVLQPAVFGLRQHDTELSGLSWLVLRLTGSAVDLSLVGACNFGPSLILAAAGGTLAQRWPRRSVLLATQILLFATSMLLFALDRAGDTQVWFLLLVSLASGIVAAVDGPARQLFVRDLVGGGGVASAVSLYEVVLNGARVFGPALGGALLAVSGPDACFLANGLSYVAPLAVLLAIAPCPRHRDTDTPRSPRAIRSALHYVADNPEIKVCLWLAVALGMVFNAGTILPIMTSDVLHRGGAAYGSLLTAFGAGALPGALMAGRAPEPSGRTLRILVAASAGAVLLTARSVSYPMMLIGEAIIGFVSIWTIAPANTMVQLRSRTDMRGPVMGLSGQRDSRGVPGHRPARGDHCGARRRPARVLAVGHRPGTRPARRLERAPRHTGSAAPFRGSMMLTTRSPSTIVQATPSGDSAIVESAWWRLCRLTPDRADGGLKRTSRSGGSCLISASLRPTSRHMSVQPIGPSIMSLAGVQGPSATAARIASNVANGSQSGSDDSQELELAVLGKALQTESAAVNLLV